MHAGRSKAPERVILAYCESELRSRCKKPVGFVYSTCDKIVDQDPDVGCLSAEYDRLFSLQRERSVHSGNYTLSRGFLVAGSTVDLSGEEKTWYCLHLQRRIELSWRIIVVFDRVSCSIHSDLIEPANGAQNLELHFGRERSRQTVDVELRCFVSLWLEEQLVPLRIRKLYDLVFD